MVNLSLTTQGMPTVVARRSTSRSLTLAHKSSCPRPGDRYADADADLTGLPDLTCRGPLAG